MSDEIFDTVEEQVQSEPSKAFVDQAGQFPKPEYINVASTNLAARGLKTNELLIGGAPADMNLDLIDLPQSEYPLNQVRETLTGHVTEMDDTPGRERLLFKHRTGAGIDMRPDGTVIINSKYNTIEITGNDQKIIVKGDGDIQYQGNLKLRVSGDMDVEVGGNYNLKVHGDKREEIRGNYQQKVIENHETSIIGNQSLFLKGTGTDTILGNYNMITKGTMTTRVEKDYNLFVDDETMITSKDELSISTKNANISATDMVLQSATGMIGGDTVFHYGKNYYGTSATFTAGVTAPTFTGDLTGKADDANQADFATSAGQAPLGPALSPGSNTHVATNTDVRTSFPAPGPDASWLNEYLTQSAYGYRFVKIDVGDVIKDEIDQSTNTGGVSRVKLTTREVRSKLRDPNTATNSQFIGRMQSEGVLSANFADRKPTGFTIGRIANTDGTARRYKPERVYDGYDPTQKLKVTNNTNKVVTITPDQLYNPELQLVDQGVIDARTQLAPSVRLGTFLGGHGEVVTMNHITDETERVRIAKNLYLHAKFMKSAQAFLDKNNRHNINVVEGFYKPGPNETLVIDSLNDQMSKGRAVVYEVIDRNGQVSLRETFRLAEYVKDFYQFEKMVLDYDTYDPSEALNVQIILVMPEVSPQWTVSFDNKIETRYNNHVQTNGELVEIL